MTNNYVVYCGTSQSATRTFRRFAEQDDAIQCARVLVGGQLPDGTAINAAVVQRCDGVSSPENILRCLAPGFGTKESRWDAGLKCWVGVEHHLFVNYRVEFAGGVTCDVLAHDEADASRSARLKIADREGIPVFSRMLLRARPVEQIDPCEQMAEMYAEPVYGREAVPT